jgi:hypothetical protein
MFRQETIVEARQRGRLGKEYERRLERLPGWTWDVRQDQWELGIQRLKEFIEKHGHALVPAKLVVDGYRLGSWVNMQRTRYLEGSLEQDRIDRLETVPGWTWDARDTVWEEAIRDLEEYVEQNGNAIVPITYRTANGFKLGQWVSVQRTRYEKGIIAQERRERLDALPGWAWNVQDYLWEEGVRHFEAYFETHGNALIPLRYTSDDGYQLGAWVNTQRVAYGRGTLPPHRKQRLHKLPGWSWSAKDFVWEDGLSRLLRYVKVHRHANVPQKYADADGYRLGSWVTVQRAARKAGRLKPEREARLSAVPGWDWNRRRGPKNWDEG